MLRFLVFFFVEFDQKKIWLGGDSSFTHRIKRSPIGETMTITHQDSLAGSSQRPMTLTEGFP